MKGKISEPISITKSIDLSLVIIDPDLQQRVKLDKSVIEDYAIALSNGEVFPPITVWHNTEDGRNYGRSVVMERKRTLRL